MTALRWIAVLPAGIVGVIAANFLLHWVLVATLSGDSATIQADVAPVERAILPVVAAMAFIAAGAYAAPRHRIATGAALAGLLGAAWAAFAGAGWGTYFVLGS